MILESRKWRLLIRMITLAITGILILAFAAPASYALQDDRPKLLNRSDQLFDKVQPITDKYIYTSSVPDLVHIVKTQTLGNLGPTYYWISLPQYNNQLIVRTEGNSFLRAYYQALDLNLDSQPRPGHFYGKITTLSGQADSQKVVDDLAVQGVTIDKDTAMVLLQGEEPGTYRPMVPVVGMLALFWIFALVGLFRILRGKRPNHRVRRT